MADLEALKRSYDERQADGERLAKLLAEQVGALLADEGISLAVPIEHRLKSWQSVAAKVERNKLTITRVAELGDLVGLRIILLFKRDTERVRKLLGKQLHQVSAEDVTDRLGTETFGYQSIHLQGKLPRAWAELPTFRGCADLPVEVQVRTAAQHIWAAASHLLQYKQEGSVPRDVLRSINRVSALLETVDLEFERVLDQREEYTRGVDTSEDSQPLNVDLLRKMLDERLAPENRDDNEDYAGTLAMLLNNNIGTVGELQKLIDIYLDAAVAAEKTYVDLMKKGRMLKTTYGDDIWVTDNAGHMTRTTESRRARGVFFNHLNFVDRMLNERYRSTLR